MKAAELTCPAGRTHKELMKRGSTAIAVTVLMAGLLALPGCITVNAPDEAIVIELNINISGEVVLRLADDAESAIEENADIF